MRPSPAIAEPIQPAPAAAANEPAAARQRIWRYLRALGANASEADDLAQETLLAACRSTPHDDAALAGFQLGIARNLWLRSRRWWQRRREREVADAVDQLWLDTADNDDGEELLASLRECLEQLQPRARLALDLHYRDGLAWTEVSTHIGLQPNGTKTLAQRARQALRTCIERRHA